ncbi:MAG: ATP-dependent Clp protease proteolytic subunit [Variibacter sp.]
MANNIQRQIFAERAQFPSTRTAAIRAVEKNLNGRTLVTFFTSFNHIVEIENDDCDMLQSVLQHIDLKKGLALMIDSPGGDGLAAELIVNTCRAYSGTGDYWVIVPGSAKSAASIICMGASKILMADSSQLGPVDPQIIRREGNNTWRQFSAYNLVSSYDKLFASAVSTKGNLEPYLQQLQAFDIRDINHYRDLISLSEDIAIKILKSGMMKGKTKAQIRKSIQLFLDPKMGTISHSRSINRAEAADCGLTIEKLDVHSPRWQAIYELYVRTQEFVNSRYASKCVESSDECFTVPAPQSRA